MSKFESLDRILADLSSKRALQNESKNFINILRNIVGIVGEDYVYGLIRMKDFEWSKKNSFWFNHFLSFFFIIFVLLLFVKGF